MSAGAAAAAAAHQAKLREEEERLTTYNGDDLQGWEFKIVRSVSKITGEKFRTLCDEEAQNGWELLEKFDDTRIRFKRRTEQRKQDQYAEIAPYRTSFGISEGKFA
ncbi:MAG: hypothetical protein NUK65_12480, partial [Firmicutes bacterium]|nr:hypothetical protein [Bacillota bacterium]